MATVLDCARLAQAAYTGTAPDGWRVIGNPQLTTGGLWGAFQGYLFAQGNIVVVAFKGTALDTAAAAGDVVADAKLGVGMNTVQFDQAEAFLDDNAGFIPRGATVYVCGHSLGGAIAQIVGNRRRLPFVTFNAPGVGVIAGNLGDMASQTSVGLTARAAGSVLSVVRHPVQAWRDARSLFYRVQGTNVRLSSDPVSMVGIHYGRVATLSYLGLDAHSIATVIRVLMQNPPTALANLEGFTRR